MKEDYSDRLLFEMKALCDMSSNMVSGDFEASIPMPEIYGRNYFQIV